MYYSPRSNDGNVSDDDTIPIDDAIQVLNEFFLENEQETVVTDADGPSNFEHASRIFYSLSAVFEGMDLDRASRINNSFDAYSNHTSDLFYANEREPQELSTHEQMREDAVTPTETSHKLRG